MHKITLNYNGVPSWDQVPAQLPAMKGGLYVFLFSNKSNVAIYDNNDTPKIVIQPAGLSMKPGKFEGTLLERATGYQSHLHYTENGSPRWMFIPCLAAWYVVELTDVSFGFGKAARILERYWTEGIDHFLRDNDLLAGKQKGRAEWRHLQPTSWNDNVKTRFEIFLEELEERMRAMLAAGQFRSK